MTERMVIREDEVKPVEDVLHEKEENSCGYTWDLILWAFYFLCLLLLNWDFWEWTYLNLKFTLISKKLILKQKNTNVSMPPKLVAEYIYIYIFVLSIIKN